jgi:hypothetical protein
MAHLNLMLDEHHERDLRWLDDDAPNAKSSRIKAALELCGDDIQHLIATFGTDTAVPKPKDRHPHPDIYLDIVNEHLRALLVDDKETYSERFEVLSKMLAYLGARSLEVHSHAKS